jgi:ribonuclease HI
MPNTLLATHGIAFESIELLRWRCDNFVAEWEYDASPFPLWNGDGDAIHEDTRLVVYTDGACQHQGDPRICSAGCGIFVCSGHPWNTSFVLPGATYSSEQAELRALLHVIEGATEQNIDIIAKLDNQYVVDKATEVLAGSCCWPASGHDLWRRLSLAQSKQVKAGLSGHKVTWIKGHATHLDVEMEIISSADRFGNFNADRLASAAASRSCCPSVFVALSKVRGLQAREVQSYIVEVLLSRQLLLLEQSATKAPSAGRPCHSTPMEVSANLASIRAAFLALHSF